MALTPKDVDSLHDSAKKLLGLWMQLKLVFQRSFGSQELKAEHEAAYLQLKSEISRINRGMMERLPKGLNFESDKLQEMLKNAITMENLRNQPGAEKQNILATWHRIYIKMTRAIGALEVMQSGYYPHVHRAKLKTVPPPQRKTIKV